ncbi:hypothetical protein [Bacteroides acidifaciens]|uniref:hypothetical protein n=1 Tax=Bacteroides acidifaciens TaxID=85831 RepID=UPI000468A800|nr:hypothetical protein [Bacteroides acidifaciens]MCR1997901.1 hypothetical protein [Bacteroides acidifaciens]
MPAITHAMEVASAAPITPQPIGNIIYQSSPILTMAATICIVMAYFGEPSSRISIIPTHWMNRKIIPGSNQIK